MMRLLAMWPLVFRGTYDLLTQQHRETKLKLEVAESEADHYQRVFANRGVRLAGSRLRVKELEQRIADLKSTEGTLRRLIGQLEFERDEWRKEDSK